MAALSALLFFLVDQRTQVWLIATNNQPWMAVAKEIVTPFGKFDRIVGMLAILWLTGHLWKNTRCKQAAGLAMTSLICAGIPVLALKFLTHRPRPLVLPGHVHSALSGYYQSFPSAEAASAFAVALGISAFFPKSRIPLLFVAVMIAAMRVLRLAHWPSDAVMGAAFGCVGYLIAARRLHKKSQM